MKILAEKYWSGFVLTLLLLFIAPVFGAPAHAEEIAKNTVFLEAFGNGFLYSINYDRLLTESLSVRVGYSSFSIGMPLFGENGKISATVIPVMLNYLFGEGDDRLEVGAGACIIPYLNGIMDGIFFIPIQKTAETTSTSCFTSHIGYRHQPKQGGGNARISLICSIIQNQPYVNVGASYGFTF